MDVDNNLEDLTLTVLPGTGYSIAENDIIINETLEVLVPVNIRIIDPGSLSDEGVLNVDVLDNTGIEDMVEINTNNLGSGIYIYKVSTKSVYKIGRITISSKL